MSFLDNDLPEMIVDELFSGQETLEKELFVKRIANSELLRPEKMRTYILEKWKE